MYKKTFTLVETIIVIVVLGIIAGVGTASMLGAADALAFLTVRADMDQSADVVMSRMLTEMRRLKDDLSVHGDTNLTQFRFTDIDDRDINYYLSGNSLMRNTDILADDVDSITFTYYDDNGNILNPPAVGIGTLTDIRRIQINLVLQKGTYILSYESEVRPRNLKHIAYKFK